MMILFTIYTVFFSFDPVRRRMPRYRKRLFLGSFHILSKQPAVFSADFAARKKAASLSGLSHILPSDVFIHRRQCSRRYYDRLNAVKLRQSSFSLGDRNLNFDFNAFLFRKIH